LQILDEKLIVCEATFSINWAEQLANLINHVEELQMENCRIAGNYQAFINYSVRLLFLEFL